MMKLSDTQLVILSAACQRPDNSVYPLAAKLNGGAASKVLNSLLGKKLIVEVQATRDDTVWREHRKRGRLTLRASPAAFEALGIDQPAAADDAETEEAITEANIDKSSKPRKSSKAKPGHHATRGDSKQSQLIEMLKRRDGASIEEIVSAFGWQPHTVRGAIAGALKKKLGLNVGSEKIEGRGRVYRIA